MPPKHLIHIAVACALGLIILSAVVGRPVASDEAASDPPPYVPFEVVGQLGGEARTVAVQGDFAYVGIDRRLVVMDISTPSQPVVVGQTQYFEESIGDVDVVGNRAYVVYEQKEYHWRSRYEFGTLVIVDISAPTRPTTMGRLTLPWSSLVTKVDVTGDIAYLGAEDDFWVIDVSVPTDPMILGHCEARGSRFLQATPGDVLYLGWGVVQAIDISDLTHPTVIGDVAEFGIVRDLVISGDVAYTAGGDGFRVLDISNPASPTLLGQYPAFVYERLAVAGNVAYITNESGELAVIDVSDPTEPRLLSHRELSPAGKDIAAVDDHVYLTGRGDGLVVIDASNPTTPTVLARSHAGLPRSASGVAAACHYAYVADDVLVVLDISNPIFPALVARHEMEERPWDVAVAGRYAYVIADHALQVVDVSEAVSPTLVSQCEIPFSVRWLTLAGNRVYATAYGSDLAEIDISNPATPRVVNTYDLPEDARDVALVGDIAYVARGDEGLTVLDVTNPVSPTLLGQINTPHKRVHQVSVSGDLLYVLDNAALNVFDVSDPTAAVLMGNCFMSGDGDLLLQGDRAYVTNWVGVSIVDISDPMRPQVLNSCALPKENLRVTVAGDQVICYGERIFFLRSGPAQSEGLRLPLIMVDARSHRRVKLERVAQIGGGVSEVTVRGETAYVGLGSRLAVLDISELLTVTLLGQSDSLPRIIQEIVLDGDLAYARDERGFSIVDISDPTAPRPLGRWNTDYRTTGLDARGDLACLADDDGGLSILGVSDPTAPRLLSRYPMQQTLDVVMSENYAFTASHSLKGLRVLDISQPGVPLLAATCRGLFAHHLVRQGDLILGVFNLSNGCTQILQAFDVSDPMSPCWLGRGRDMGYTADDLAVSGDYACVLGPCRDEERRFLVVDISDPQDPRHLGGTGRVEGSRVDMAGEMAYVAGDPRGLAMVDLSNPEDPEILARYEPMGGVRDIALLDGGAYLAANRLYCLQEPDDGPPQPVEIPGWSPSLVEVVGDRAYLIQDERLVLLDITDPVSPTLLGEYHFSLGSRDEIRALAAMGGLAYAVVDYGYDDGLWLEAIDFLEPGSPLLASRVKLDDEARDVVAVGNIVYVLHGDRHDVGQFLGSLWIIDVSNPDQPMVLGKCDTCGGGYDVAIAGDYAYIANGERGLAIIDASQPVTPALVGRCAAPKDAHKVAVLGDIAYVASEDGACYVYDISDRTQPLLIGSGEALGSVQEMAVRGDTVYVAGDMGGLVVLRASGVPLPPEATPTPSPTGRSTRTPTPTNTLTPTPTQTLTRTPKPTRTRRPTRTLRPTRTPRPTAEPTIPEPTLLPA